MIAEGGHVVRSCSMWRMTRAAATIFLIRQGLRLMLRSARNVILSRELPRSPIARRALWALLNCCLARVIPAPFGLLETDGYGLGQSFVAQVAEGA